MPSLVRGKGNSLYIFLYSAIYNFLNLPVVSKMYYFNTCTLKYAPHDIDSGIVPVK